MGCVLTISWSYKAPALKTYSASGYKAIKYIHYSIRQIQIRGSWDVENYVLKLTSFINKSWHSNIFCTRNYST